MKQQFLSQQGSTRLILFFCGWGMDEHLLADLPTGECDLLCCFDYHDLTFDVSMLEGYKEITVMAWSLGVWVASNVLPQKELPITYSIAVNGTLNPIDNEQGIPPHIFQGTIDHLDERGLRKFNRRMCNTAEEYEQFMKQASNRSVNDLKEELVCLRDLILNGREKSDCTFKETGENDTVGHTSLSSEEEKPGWFWNRVYVSQTDRIFPCDNQLKAWQGIAPVETLSEGHYCPRLFAELVDAYGQESHQ